MTLHEHTVLAAIDLGSNSFHLQVARVEGEQLFYLDAHKESVRLAGGLDAENRLDMASQKRALACLARFAERVQGMAPETVRVVGTNTLRVAENASDFLERGQAALGFNIEVVAGREEARLIYLGVAHSLAHSEVPRFVVDIGGGSTELIIGTGYTGSTRESTRMGCVVYTNRFFPDRLVTRAAMKAAVTAAKIELHPVVSVFQQGQWVQAVGSSGTARALGEILRANGHSDGEITRDGLKWLRHRLVEAGDIHKLELAGLKADRQPVIAGGVAVMSGVFDALHIETMVVAQGAMREGILWDLLGRHHHHDMRAITVRQFMRRYRVDGPQARRVETTALALYDAAGWQDERARLFLSWAALLHEIGLSIAHSGQQRHAAYILENADMPGFSRQDQAWLARMVRGSRGRLAKLDLAAKDDVWPPMLCLRLAIVLHRSRVKTALPPMELNQRSGRCTLRLPADWLRENPLARAELDDERISWSNIEAAWRLERIQAASQ